jgi:putative PIN family toxin of toxin-antitoxin system
MRVVLDTNILCSALITPGGPADRLYLAWRDGTFTLVSSEEQLEEFRRVTRYPKVRRYIEPAAAGSMYNELRHLAVPLTNLPVVEASRDPTDNFLLAMAQLGEADFLVTGDKRDLLSLRAFRGTKIVTASRMLEYLGGKRQPAKRAKGRGRPQPKQPIK